MTLNSKFNILIADDHELILEGLKLQLLDVEEIKQVSIAKNKNELNNILSKNKIDIIFLDIHFGAYDGREIAIELKKNYPNILLAAFTSFDDKETISFSKVANKELPMSRTLVELVFVTNAKKPSRELLVPEHEIQSGFKFLEEWITCEVFDTVNV